MTPTFTIWVSTLSLVTPILTAFLIYNLSRRDKAEKRKEEDRRGEISKVEIRLKEDLSGVKVDIKELHQSQLLLESEVRSLESRQITIEEVKDLLRDRVKPVEDTLHQLDRDMRSNYNDLDRDLKQTSLILQEGLRSLSGDISYIKGKLETKDGGH